MYSYEWDEKTGGYLLTTKESKFSNEPRPVYYQELDVFGFDKFWKYKKDDSFPYMWAEANNYIYKGKKVAQLKGGSLYTAPEIKILETIEEELTFVNIKKMLVKNDKVMSSIVNETIKKIYNTYTEFKNKVDIIYVAYSGGKDSIALLDIVQRSLPHDAFKTVFANTDMEFEETLNNVKQTKDWCLENQIDFIEAKSHYDSVESWNIFGPPARRLRWCCSVHKSVPIINELCKNVGKTSIKTIMITGVRGDESASRSGYEELSMGNKINNQMSFHPLLDWSSAELYLYIYGRNLIMNEAYKFGFNRIGCIICPNSSERHEFLKNKFDPVGVKKYCDIIVSTSGKDLEGSNREKFLETGGWKMRISGRELKQDIKYFYVEHTKPDFICWVYKDNELWKEWYKTIGSVIEIGENSYKLEFKNEIYLLQISKENGNYKWTIKQNQNTKNYIKFISYLKIIIIKSLYCVDCKLCVAECQKGNIEMTNTTIKINDECNKCKACLDIISGCIYYNSIKTASGVDNVKGINRYLSVGVKGSWIKSYFDDIEYRPGNRKDDAFFAFMSDCGLVHKRKNTEFFGFSKKIGLSNDYLWGLFLSNLAYTPQFKWYILNVPFDVKFTKDDFFLTLGDDIKDKAKNEIISAFKEILITTTLGKRIGLGDCDYTTKTLSNGVQRITLNSITRTSWNDPDSRVILYSLYKFAENCGDYKQFTLTRLMNFDIESDGVSPAQIFGISRSEFETILNGLSTNYSDFIHASFTLDLDNITLRDDKTSQDVLKLFEEGN